MKARRASQDWRGAHHDNGGLKVVHKDEAADALGQVGDAHHLGAVLPCCIQLLHITDAQVVVVLALQPTNEAPTQCAVCLCRRVGRQVTG